MQQNIYLGLVHYPVYNKFYETVTTSITNLDIHDISRSCLTYGIKKYFIINPLSSQKDILMRIKKFWQSEIARNYNPHRVEALSILEYAKTIENAMEIISNQEKVSPLLITTTAAKMEAQIKIKEFSKLKINRPVFLLFGTGNGLTKELHKLADYILEPIWGTSEFNHLSVRSAVAIVLDRLFSEK